MFSGRRGCPSPRFDRTGQRLGWAPADFIALESDWAGVADISEHLHKFHQREIPFPDKGNRPSGPRLPPERFLVRFNAYARRHAEMDRVPAFHLRLPGKKDAVIHEL